jgi:hypothetical protein
MAEQPLGPRLIEGGWGAGLILPPGPAKEAADYLYPRLFDGARIMAKPWEYVHNRQRFETHTMARVRAARDLGIKIQLSIDIHNSADDRGGYHNRREIPAQFQRVVKEIILLIDPDEIEVINEPYASTNHPGPGNYGRRLNIKQYKDDFFNVYAEAARQANWRGLFCAWQDHTDQTRRPPTPGNFRDDSWIWHGEWTQCAEVQHDFVLDTRSTDPQEFYNQILAKMDNPRQWAVGWRYGLFQNEHSSVGRQVHINSQLGADMCEASWNAHRDIKCAWGFLTVGGYTPDFGNEGGWGMNTDLINDKGEFSLGCQRLMQLAGVDIPDVGNGGGGGGGGGGGISSLHAAQKQLERAERRWGTERGLRHAQRAIGHIENAIGRA